MESAKANKYGVALIKVLPIFMIIYIVLQSGIDADTWFILNNGRYLFENGFPETNPFTITENMPVILSQWAFAMAEYLFYYISGNAGLLFFHISIACLLYCSVYDYFKTSAEKTDKLYLYLFSFAVTVLFSSFLTTRPQPFTAVLLILEMKYLKKYEKTGKIKYLLPLPLVSFMVANTHMPFYVFCYLPILAHLAGTILNMASKVLTKKKVFDDNTKVLPLFCVIPFMLLFGFFNPYGIDGNLFLFSSIGSVQNLGILELQTPNMLNICTYEFWIVFGLLVFLFVKSKEKSKNPSDIFFFLGGAVLFPFAIRNFWSFVLFSIPMTGRMIDAYNYVLERYKRTLYLFLSDIKWKIEGSFLVIMFFIVNVSNFSSYTEIKDHDTTPVLAVEYLNENTKENARENVKILTTFNSGAYFGFCGYPVYIDARPELYNIGDKNICVELVTAMHTGVGMEEILDENDFDYVFAHNNANILKHIMDESSNYDECVTSEEYSLYRKIR